ncbi:MAG: sterol desaturase family protein [Alphaproteobacteria bacterium]|nr:sterol desaturase family protein [Alphaproteobacteria bacterium]
MNNVDPQTLGGGLEGLPRLVFDIVLGLVKPLFAFNQHDSFLYWPFLTTALILALLVYVVQRRDGGSGFFQRYFSRRIWGHPSAKADYKFYYINGVLFPAIFAPMILSGAWIGGWAQTGLQMAFGPGPNFLTGTWTTVFYTIVFFLVYDFGRYLAHFVLHRFDILWQFHKVHHSAEVLTPFTAFRAHPVDLIVMATFPALTTGLVNGAFNYWSGGAAGYYLFFGLHALVFIYNLVGNLRHSPVWLSYGPVLSQIVISPAQHQIHHSIEERHWGCNMGFALAIWDAMFGTLYIPKGRETFAMGLGDGTESSYHGVIGMYWQPIRNVFKRKGSG